AVAGVLLDDAVAERLGVLLDGVADVADPAAEAGSGQAAPHGLLGHLEEPLQLGRDLTDRERDGRVAVPALEDRAAVEGDDVTLAQHLVLARDAVDDLVVDRRADGGGVTVVALE